MKRSVGCLLCHDGSIIGSIKKNYRTDLFLTDWPSRFPSKHCELAVRSPPKVASTTVSTDHAMPWNQETDMVSSHSGSNGELGARASETFDELLI